MYNASDLHYYVNQECLKYTITNFKKAKKRYPIEQISYRYIKYYLQ